MSMTVLNVAYPFAPVGRDAVGGAEQVLAQLDRALAAAGHRSLVVACAGSQTQGTLLAAPAPPDRVDERARAATHRQYRDLLRQALDRWPVDVVHLHGVDCAAYLPPSGVPTLVTLHLPLAWYPADLFERRSPHTVLCCVSATQRAGCPPTGVPLATIANGVDCDVFAAPRRKRHFVAALGRICPEKGFHLALDAAALADMPMLLAGRVFPYTAHERYFRTEVAPRLSGSRRFVGPLGFEAKRRVLGAARCLLVPSLVPETSSLVAMEALACGTPVVAFRAGAVAEIVEPGLTGFLVDSVEEMAQAIRMVDTLSPDLCRQRARERFAAETTTRAYLSLYARLAHGAEAQQAAAA